MPQSINDFANLIKSKYPTYQSMDNTDLVNKIIAKYPVYKQQVNASELSTVNNGGLPSFISTPDTTGMKAGAVTTGAQENTANNAKQGSWMSDVGNAVKSGLEASTENLPVVGGLVKGLQTTQQADNQVTAPQGKTPEQATPGADLAIGAAKGLGSTVMGVGQLGAAAEQAITKPLTDAIRPAVQSVTEPVVKSALGQAPTDQQVAQNMQQTKENFTTPNGPGETAGFGAEQLAEFLAPEGWVSKGVDAANAGLKAAEVGSGLEKAGTLAARAGLEGASAGAVSAAQSGKVDKGTAEMAGLGAAIPIASKAVEAVWKPISKGIQSLSESQITKLIRPDAKAYVFGKNPAKAIIDEGITANSFKDLISQIGDKQTEIGSQIAEKAKSATTTTNKIADIINKNADDFGKKVLDKNTWKAYADKLQQLTGEFKADLKTGELVKTADKDLSNMTANDVWKTQQKVGKLTKWTGAVGENEANQQLHKLYSQLGRELDKMAPGTKDLQMRYANMLGAEKSAVARDAVVRRNNNIVSSGIWGSAGALLNPASAITHSDDPFTKASSVVLGALAPRLFESPAFRTRMAQLLASEGIATPEVLNALKGATLSYASKNINQTGQK